MDNVNKLRGSLESYEVDALLVTSEVNRRYASNHPTSEGIALIGGNGAYYLTDSRYIEAASEMRGFEVMKTDGHDKNKLLNDIIVEEGLEVLGFEEEYLTVAEFKDFEKALTARLEPTQGLFTELRGVKEPWELEIMKRAQALADKTFEEILGLIRPGISEHELATEIIYRLMKNGAEGISFDPIVVAGPNSSRPHGIPGDRPFQKGDFVTMDFGCKLEGYCSDMTRTVALGHASDEMKQVYETVLQAQLRGISAAKAGVPGASVDAAAREYIKEAGYGQYFEHGFGHSLGLEIHEKPNANPKNDRPLPAGAVISAEPGIYIPGKFGVRIEDVIIIKEQGSENITGSKKELIVL